MSNYIPLIYMDVIINPYPNLNAGLANLLLVKEAPDYQRPLIGWCQLWSSSVVLYKLIHIYEIQPME